MGRDYSKKAVKDTESAAETVVPDSLSGNAFRKSNEAAMKLSVTAGMHADRPFDGDIEKRI